MIYVKYINTVLKHKYFVLISGIRIGVSIWQLFKHDLSKLLPSEFFPYAKYFSHTDRSESIKRNFRIAWHKHKHRNPHHPEYWIYVNRDGQIETMEMPVRCALEWISDIMAADRVYSKEPNLQKWLQDNFRKFKFHPKTKQFILKVLKEKLNIEL